MSSAPIKAVRIPALADETVDALVWRAVGTRAGLVETVHAANPGLASLGPFLPEGTDVVVPLPATDTPTAPLVQLWS
jgi:phage tail protein X